MSSLLSSHISQIQLSSRISQIQPSATIAVNTRAAELRAAGHSIINLSVGEPDFDTPDVIKQAAIEAIQQGFTKYTAVDGIPELKQAIITKLQRDNQLDYQPNEILVSNGVKHAMYNLAQILLNEGDEVIIPAPYWVSYPDIAKLAGGKPVILETTIKNRFKITPEQLAKAITPRTRLMVINSPSNPSGVAYNEAELKAIGEVLKQHPNVIIASDDMYEYILWGQNRFVNIVNACPELKSQTIVMNGVSKAHAMTGWRIGYSAGPAPIIAAMKKIQSQNTSNPCSISQKASVRALACTRDELIYMFDAFKQRHDMVYAALSKMKNIEVTPADGAFYLFINTNKAIRQLELRDDIALAEHLLNEAKVAMVPGTAFGMPGYLRMSCATSEQNLAEALKRLAPIFG